MSKETDGDAVIKLPLSVIPLACVGAFCNGLFLNVRGPCLNDLAEVHSQKSVIENHHHHHHHNYHHHRQQRTSTLMKG